IRYHHPGSLNGPATMPVSAPPTMAGPAPSALPVPAMPVARSPASVTSPPVVVMGDHSGTYLPAQTGLVNGEGPLLASLVQQFNLMQQHMFDQFQQTLIMMAQMLSSMHQEHAALMREEMAQFHRATAELQQLQKQAREAGVAVPPSATAE